MAALMPGINDSIECTLIFRPFPSNYFSAGSYRKIFKMLRACD